MCIPYTLGFVYLNKMGVKDMPFGTRVIICDVRRASMTRGRPHPSTMKDGDRVMLRRVDKSEVVAWVHAEDIAAASPLADTVPAN